MGLLDTLGSLIGRGQAQGDLNQENSNRQKSFEVLNNLSAPDIEKMKLALSKYESAGQLDPRLETPEQLAMKDALQNVQTDPRLKQQQTQALDMYSKLAGSGFTPDELVSMDAQRRQNMGNTNAQVKALQQAQDARGMGSSDMAMAQKLLATQAGANRQASDNAQQRAQAYKRSLDAIAQGANLAGSMDNTEYARQAALAQNLNSRELTNLNQRANVNSANVNRFNSAQAANLANKQAIMNQNTGLSNDQQRYNKELNQRNFENQTKLGQIKAGNFQNEADRFKDRAQTTIGNARAVGSLVEDAAKAYATGGASEMAPENTGGGTGTSQKRMNYGSY